ncbi:MAG: tripartite tricarboxylate transporter substrate binding protein [Alphaproteobacteria bacterium]|nr:tripartite tricarboxylate transporter substrate binding protein [Alphaproteobacteria bacterium]
MNCALPRRHLLASAAALAGASVLPSGARAQAWPARPINVIIAYPAGGSTDIAARAILPYLEKNLPGASFVAVNRAGAGGEVGTTELSTSAPDGHTIGFLNAPSFIMKPYERRTRYTKDSFTYLGNLVYDAGAIAVRADSPVRSFTDLVARLKAQPASLGISSAGLGTDDHLGISIIQRQAGIQFNHVPFNGDAPAVTNLLGGHVDMCMLNIGYLTPRMRAGQLRVLAVAAEERHKWAPDVPTFRELGINYVGGSSRGLGAPKGLPAPIAAKLIEVIGKAVADPAFQEASDKQFVPLNFVPGEQYRAFVDRLDRDLDEIWKVDPWKR